MANLTDNAVSTLNTLIETCKDRENGFRTAADAVNNDELKTLFSSYAGQSAQYAAELQDEVRRLGGDPEVKGSVAGWFLRGWMQLKSAVTARDEAAIIAECERGEDSARNNFESALKETLPTSVQAMLHRQYAASRKGTTGSGPWR